MNTVFYLSAAIAIIATAMVITRANAMHALLYLIVSFLAVSLMFFTLGAPFIAALEVIVYAGAIMVLFVFAIMLFNLGPQSALMEHQWLRTSGWIGPAILSLILLSELVFELTSGDLHAPAGNVIDPRQVGAAVFSTYLIGVELASILLLASLVGANHLRRHKRVEDPLPRQQETSAVQNSTKDWSSEETPVVRTSAGKSPGEFQDEKVRNESQGTKNNTGEGTTSREL